MEIVDRPLELIRNERVEFKIASLIGYCRNVASHDNNKKIDDKNDNNTKLAFSFNPVDLVFDIQGNIKCLTSSNENDETDESDKYYGVQDKLCELKSLIGFVMQNKFSYDDYLKGGMSLLKKNKDLKPLFTLSTVEDTEKYLQELYEKKIEYGKKNIVEVNRKKRTVIRIILILSIVINFALVGSAVYYIYYANIKNSRNDVLISIQTAYLNQDYKKCKEILKTVNVEELDNLTKKILAISVVNESNYTYVKLERELELINNTETDLIYNYWLFIGQNNYLDAENIALQLSSDDMLLNAYVKEKEYLINETNIDGFEKSDRLNQIEQEIKDINGL